MAIAFDAAVDGGDNGGTTNSHTFSHTCTGSDRLLVVHLVGDVITGNDDITSVVWDPTGANQALTLLDKNTTLTGARFGYMYYLLGPTGTGSKNITVSCTNNHYLLAGAASYTGVSASGQPDATNKNVSVDDADSQLAISVTSVADNCWQIMTAHGYGANVQPSAVSGCTRRAAEGAFGTWGAFDSAGPKTPAGSVTFTWQHAAQSLTDMASIIASFAPGTGAVASVRQQRLMRMGMG